MQEATCKNGAQQMESDMSYAAWISAFCRHNHVMVVSSVWVKQCP